MVPEKNKQIEQKKKERNKGRKREKMSLTVNEKVLLNKLLLLYDEWAVYIMQKRGMLSMPAPVGWMKVVHGDTIKLLNAKTQLCKKYLSIRTFTMIHWETLTGTQCCNNEPTWCIRSFTYIFAL